MDLKQAIEMADTEKKNNFYCVLSDEVFDVILEAAKKQLPPEENWVVVRGSFKPDAHTETLGFCSKDGSHGITGRYMTFERALQLRGELSAKWRNSVYTVVKAR